MLQLCVCERKRERMMSRLKEGGMEQGRIGVQEEICFKLLRINKPKLQENGSHIKILFYK